MAVSNRDKRLDFSSAGSLVSTPLDFSSAGTVVSDSLRDRLLAGADVASDKESARYFADDDFRWGETASSTCTACTACNISVLRARVGTRIILRDKSLSFTQIISVRVSCGTGQQALTHSTNDATN